MYINKICKSSKLWYNNNWHALRRGNNKHHHIELSENGGKSPHADVVDCALSCTSGGKRWRWVKSNPWHSLQCSISPTQATPDTRYDSQRLLRRRRLHDGVSGAWISVTETDVGGRVHTAQWTGRKLTVSWSGPPRGSPSVATRLGRRRSPAAATWWHRRKTASCDTATLSAPDLEHSTNSVVESGFKTGSGRANERGTHWLAHPTQAVKMYLVCSEDDINYNYLFAKYMSINDDMPLTVEHSLGPVMIQTTD